MTKKKNKFIIDVVPLTKIPLTNNQSFSYLSDIKISPQSLVFIPLFHREVKGIVLAVKNDFPRTGNIKLKKITKIIEKKILTSRQIKLAKFISEYYISPLGVVMKNFVVDRVKARKTSYPLLQVASFKRRGGNIILTSEQKKAINEITKKTINYNLESNSYLLFGPAGAGKTEVYIYSMLALKKQDKNFQFLIFLPEKTLIPQALERYGAYFKSEEIGVLSSNISKRQLYSNWQGIKSGKIKIIIGTRMAVFAPFKKLGLIVIDEEQDMSYKQWNMNPRYDARIVAEELAEIYNAKIIRGSATPSIGTYFKALNKGIKLLKLPELNLEKEKIKKKEVNIVDMKKERWDKNYTSISKKLKSEIAYALKNKQQVILFINRQGMSSFSICEACKTVLKCPKCSRALVYEKSGKYKCNHCNYKTSVFPKCEKCGWLVFKNIGLGTQKVEKEISSIFPLAKIIVADSATNKKKNFQEELYQKFSRGETDILIGTQMISKGWDLPRVSLVGIIDTDNLLSFPDFLAEEKAFQIISQVLGRINRPGARFLGEIVIQTFQPENETIKLASKNNFEKFFKKIIKERESLSLPPYGTIIRLVFQDYNFEKVEKETSNVFKSLSKISEIKISEPHSPLLSKIRMRWRKQMIIKIKNKIPTKLGKELKKLNSGWIIDRDPISII